ncbi:MAG: hypothetical protein CMJ02_00015 [Pelagibacteraceae bacterium]|jgi:hypothetical protein|nr:hypothetical protein [Pelagibacteraceae bacterium]OUV89541.1 MAG: hypothetical protein CBD06_00085 [Pelagibacteraceae bacterium TMED146]RZO89614.1 MAG: hypothetical protein EVA56_04420 [alpha proteobacterium HIMB114]|tara:strand:+ start:253 stop:432 length:180 start_codon:yes stop_codon:yes gene_type:complete
MKQIFEYRVLNRKSLNELGQGVENEKKTFLENGLDYLGQSQWELISVENGEYYFKRPKD